MQTFQTRALLMLVLAVLAACESDPDQGSPGEGHEPSIISFSASAPSIALGEKVTLVWSTKYAESVRLFAGTSSVQLGDASAAVGSVEVAPGQTTIFRLEARGAGGGAASQEITVEVILPEAPMIEQFTADPGALGLGSPVTLAWKAKNATSLSLVDDEGRPVDVSSASPLQGSISVVPVVGTTYVLTAAGPGGAVSAQVSVAIVPKPTASLIADRLRIPAGTAATLRWQTSGASEAQVFAEGVEESVAEGLEGSVEVFPNRTTVYYVEATGAGGTTRTSRTISVLPVIDLFFSSATEAVRSGTDVELSWTIRGGTGARISNLGGWIHEIPAADLSGGSVMARVGTGGVFTLQARDGEVESEPKAITIALTGEPRILSALIEPVDGITAGRGEREKVTFSWVVDGAEGALSLEKIPGGPVNLVTRSNRRDQLQIEITEPTELRLTAKNAAGQHQVTTLVPVVLPPAITSFVALPSRVGGGETVSIHWSTEDADAVVLERNGSPLAVDPLHVDGSFEEMLASDGRYVLRTYNRLGFEVASRELVVTVGKPLILSFTASEQVVRPGGMLHFAWSNDGGTSLKLIERNGLGVEREVCSEVAIERIGQGGCELAAPTALDAYTYVLRVSNGDGLEQAEQQLWVSGAPTITSFSAAPAVLTEGDSVLFSWTAEEGLGGAVPTLRLVDHLAQTYELGDADPLDGQASVRIPAAGDYVFTLIAPAEEGAPPSQKSFAVQVLPLPVVDSFAAAPAFAQIDGDPVVLSWATRFGASLEIFALDREGAVSGAAVCSASAQVEAGSCTVRPTSEVPDFRLKIRNSLGALREVDLRVGVTPATIVSFTADAYDLLQGESTTLRWETARADLVELGPAFREISAPFIDVRQYADADVAFPVSGGLGNSGGELRFPDGFVFDYFGVKATGVHVCPNGALIFRAGSEPSMSSRCNNSAQYSLSVQGKPFPQTSSTGVNLAPFWPAYMGGDSPQRRESAVWKLMRTDPQTGRRSFVIQWAEFVFQSLPGGSLKGSLNFEVILFESGEIEYRYGQMRKDDDQTMADGRTALIGFQSPPAAVGQPSAVGHTLTAWSPVPGGLSNRSFRLSPIVAPYAGFVDPAGSKAITPASSFEISLIATNDHSRHEKTVRIGVHPPVQLSVAAAEPFDPQPNQSFSLVWSGVGIGSLTVEDQGTVLLSTSDPEVIAAGRFVVKGGLPQGDHLLTFSAVSPVGPRDQTSKSLSLPIYGAFDLERFEADTPLLDLGESAVLSWSGFGLEGVEILSSSGSPVALPPDQDPNAGSVTVAPTRSTTYTLVGTSHGRRKELPLSISVRSATVDSFTADKALAFEGQPISFSWSSGGGGQLSISERPGQWGAYQGLGLSMVEVTPSPTYEDISLSGGTEIAGIRSVSPFAATVGFPDGFAFPWFGEQKTSIRVMRDGSISWRLTDSNQVVSPGYPTGNSQSGEERAFLPFSQAFGSTTGTVWWKLDPSKEFFTIQWKNFASNLGFGDYNFQLVLFRDGSFEYRYGTMEGGILPSYADGGSANIGWQGPTAKVGASLTFKVSVPGGLANRAWRGGQLPASGTFSLSPSESGTFEVCRADAWWRECKSVEVQVVKVGSIVISEVLALPADDPAAQWFEVRNLGDRDFDMRGMKIVSSQSDGVKSHVIGGVDPVVIRKAGGYKVFSAKALPGVDGYVYGTASGIKLETTGAARLALAVDMPGGSSSEFAALSTSLLGAPTAGSSRSLSGERHVKSWDPAANDDGSYWCQGAPSPGASGPSCYEDLQGHYDIDLLSSMPFLDLLELPGGNSLPALTGYLGVAEIPGGVPFAFNYFGTAMPAKQTLWASTNGFAAFGKITGDDAYYTKGWFPWTWSPNMGILAPLWASYLDINPGGSFLYNSGKIDGKQVIALQWNDYTAGTGSLIFQLQIWETGDLVFAYKRMDAAAMPQAWMGGMMIGIENVGGSAGVPLWTEPPSLFPNQSILFKKK